MIPVRLQISNFLSYGDPVEVDFSEFHIACITGHNGAGKSSLLDAMTWALFGQARRRDDAIIHSRARQAEVIFDFRYEEHLYRVQRIKPANKTGLLEFFVQGSDGGFRPLTEHSIRETENAITRTLRMDYETFTNASFFLQGKADQFAQQRPGDRKRILSNILGLEIWEAYRERTAKRRQTEESSLLQVNGQLREIEEELAQEEQRRARLLELQAQLEQAAQTRQKQTQWVDQVRRLADSLAEQARLVDLLARQAETARSTHRDQAAVLQTRQSEREQYREQIARADEISASYQAWKTARQELEGWEAMAASFRQIETERAEPLLALEAEKSRLEAERDHLRARRQQMTELEANLPAVTREVQAAQDETARLQAQLAEREVLEAELRGAQETQIELSAENKRLRAEMDELKLRIQRLGEVTGAACPVCGQPLSAQDRESMAETLGADGKKLGDRFRENVEQVRRFEERRTQINQALEQLRRVEGELRAAERRLDQAHDRQVQMDAALQEWRAAGQTALDAVETRLSSGDYAAEARARLAAADERLRVLGYDGAAHDAARQAEQAGRASEEQQRALETAQAALAPLEREITALSGQVQQAEEQAASLEAHLAEVRQRYEADRAGLPDLRTAESELLGLQEQENRLRMQVGAANQSVEVLKNQRARQSTLRAEREALAVRISHCKQLERAFGKDGIPSLLIENALPEIEEHANQLLDRLTNGGMSVRFATQKDYKDKNREDKKETLDILISDPAGVREYELFSGGEAFRVNFAIRLALSRVLAQRAGARLQTLVIDEGFGSQDAEGRQRLVEAIHLVQEDFAKILVITHLEELKDAFPARIEVEKSQNGSRVQVLI